MPDLANALREALAVAADPAKAPVMQAYMKSTMPFRGVPTPERRQLTKAVLRKHGPPADRVSWLTTITGLWDDAAFREERYVALDLCAMRPARRWQDATLLSTYDHFVVSGAWWYHVDTVAGLLGPILRDDRASVEPTIRAWITDDDLWRRRTSIIVQNGAKSATDTALLADAIVANLPDREFFIRKAIGWALREYAKTDPTWVRTFVSSHNDRLSPLSRREATKNL